MNSIKYLLTLALCFCCAVAFAQKRITGHVWSSADKGPVVMANVAEIDKSNRAISATQTDANGNFSLSIKNPGNTLQISYIGYRTQRMPIGTQSNFRVELVDNTTLSTAVKVVTRKVKSNGMVIPEREISVAQQSLNMDEMQGLSFETAGEALQGQIAGLDIVSNSGNLGAGTSMRLRGVTSINGNQEPLIVVDGYILEDYDKQEFDANDMNEEKFANLLQVNPEDIASINVLKDAAATAIWGSRGSNGVIEIKTRRGSHGKTKVNFSYRFSGAWQPSGMKMLNGDQYKMMLQQAYHNPNPAAGNPADEMVELQDKPSYVSFYGNYNKNTDWIDEVTQFGQTHNYGLNISGGGDKASFRVSGSYDHETGTVIKQTLDRFTTRLALDYFVSDRIKFSSNFALTYTNQNKNYDDGLMGNAYQAMPNMAVTRHEYDRTAQNWFDTGEWYIMPNVATELGFANSVEKGLTSKYLDDMYNNGNPVAKAYESWRKWSTYTITPQFSIEYKLLGKEDEETQLNYTGEVYLNAYKPGSLSNTSTYNKDLTSNQEFKSLAFTTRHSLIFRPHFENENHSLQVMARIEASTSNSTTQYKSSSGIGGGLTDPTVPGWTTGMSTSTGKGHSMSGTGSVHYAFGSKYAFDFTIRADGSTKFGSGHKWGFFPGISGRWNISDEAFFEPLKKVISNGKLRLGWGQTGNANIGGYAWGTSMSRMPSGLGMGYRPSNIPNTSIKWESQEQWNVGVDLGFLHDRINLTVEWYKKTSSDMLMPLQLPSYMGTSGNASSALAAPKGNYGDIENTGFEISLNTHPITGKFEWDSDFQISFNKNKLKGLAGTANAQIVGYGQWTDVVSVSSVGESLYNFYGFVCDGVYKDLEDLQTSPKPAKYPANGVFDRTNTVWVGDVKYKDISGPDGVPDGVIDDYDKTNIGSPMPKFTFGWTNTFRYKNFDLSVFINGSYGNKVYNYLSMKLTHMNSPWTNQLNAVNGRAQLVPINPNKVYEDGTMWYNDVSNVMVANPGASIPRATINDPNDNDRISDRYIEDGSYIRLKNISLGYTFPKKTIDKLGLSNLRIYANIQNLLTITGYDGYDPEIGASTSSVNVYGLDNGRYPSPTVYSFGLNVSF